MQGALPYLVGMACARGRPVTRGLSESIQTSLPASSILVVLVHQQRFQPEESKINRHKIHKALLSAPAHISKQAVL